MSDLAHWFGLGHRRGATAAAALAMTVVAVTSAWSQAMQQMPAQQKSVIIQVAPAPETQPPPPAAALSPAPLAQQPPPVVQRENPGLFNEIGKLFKDTPSLVPSWSMPSLGSSNLTGTVIKGRVVCPVAANGAPDCKAASDKMCQSKGFKEGKSLDTDAAQTCSAKAMIPGRQREEGDCRTDNYVTQALCQ